ncbi:MAG: LysM peptidoglycan-binding domain-containing protein [Acidimicrobiales bacterium]
MTSNWTRRALALAALASIAGVLHAAGHVLPAPPADLDQASRWWDHTEPTVATATLVRTGSLVACYWLIAITALDTMAIAVRARPLRRITERLSPRLWRSLVLRPVVVTALATPQFVLPATMGTAVAQVSDAGAPDQHVATDVADTDGQVLVMSRSRPVTPAGQAEPSPRTLTMRWHDPDTDPADDRPGVDLPGPDAPPTQASPPELIHVVAPGENLWSIAAAHLAAEQGGSPTTRAVAAHWQALIDANRDRLPDPANPDLVYRGIELRLPPTP